MGRAADRLGRVGKKLRSLPEEMIDDGTSRLRRVVVASSKGAFGPDRKLSGLGSRARPQTVKVTKRQSGKLNVGRVMAGPARQRAPWFWLNEGTKAGPRGASGRRTFRGVHPGTPAKRVWDEPVATELPRIRKAWEQLHGKALKG